MRLRLASQSPRRAALLQAAGIRFTPGPFPDIEERLPPGLAPCAAVEAIARAKALAALPLAEPGDVVLTADTLVFLGEAPLGRPRDEAEARAHLARLSGRTHEVVTAVAVGAVDQGLGGLRVASATTRITFRVLTADEIRGYVASGEPLDKAGAYALQGGARRFVTRIEGDEDTVIGLPVPLVRRLLAETQRGSGASEGA